MLAKRLRSWLALFPIGLLIVTTGCQSGPEERSVGPSPWQPLFTGDTVENWRGFRSETFPEQGWVIENGALKVEKGGGGGDIITREKYGSFELSLEWKVEEPNANSGIIYRVSEVRDTTWQTGPEMQVLGDPAPTESSIAAGGLYALYDTEGKELAPIGSWNHALVRVCGNHVEHWLNGKKVVECELHSDDWYDRVEASKFADMPRFGTVGRGHIALQDHGDAVWYRNIKVRRLSLADEQGGAPMPLFNGRDLTGWTPFLPDGEDPAETWSVKDGVLHCTGSPRGYIKTDDSYTNFVLELDWRWPGEPGNSGVLLRTTGPDRVWPKCIEAQLMNGRAGDFWSIGGVEYQTEVTRRKGGNTRHIRANENPAGEWNHYRIVVNGGKIELAVNGELLNEAWECPIVAGPIALQSEGAPIEFRSIVLTPLP